MMPPYQNSERFLYDIALAVHRHDPRLQPGYDDGRPPVKRLPGRFKHAVGAAGWELGALLLDCELPWYQGVVTDNAGDKWVLDWRRLSPTADQKREQDEHKFEPRAWS